MESREESFKYLDRFVKLTPLGLELLKSVWPELKFSQKIYLIEEWRKARLESALRAKLDQFLYRNESNTYLRSLVAQGISEPYILNDEEPLDWQIQQQELAVHVKSDESELVRFANDGGPCSDLYSFKPDEFWQLPRIQRLYKLNGVDDCDKEFAAILNHAIENQSALNLSAEEISEAALEYLTWNNNGSQTSDNDFSIEPCAFVSRRYNYDVGPLWEILCNPSAAYPLKEILMRELPPLSGDEGIPTSIIPDLDLDFVKYLIRRKDLPLRRLRKSIWSGEIKEFRDSKYIRGNAINHIQFNFSNEEILSLRAFEPDTDEGKKKLSALIDLAHYGIGMTLAQSTMVYLMLREIDEEHKMDFRFNEAASASIHISEKRHSWLKANDPNGLTTEIHECQLFQAIFNDYTPADNYYCKKYPELAKYVVVDDPVETFVRITRAIATEDLPELWRWHSSFELLPSFSIGGDYYEELTADVYTKKKRFWHKS